MWIIYYSSFIIHHSSAKQNNPDGHLIHRLGRSPFISLLLWEKVADTLWLTDEELQSFGLGIDTSSTVGDGPPVSLRLGHILALALLTQFTTKMPLCYPLEKAHGGSKPPALRI